MVEVKCVICGMKINKNNYMMNENSFIDKNKENKIVCCPFCGAEKEYLSETEDTYNVVVTDPEIIRIFDSAMKLEVFNGEFYNEASKMAKSDELKNRFKALSSVEFFHARVHMRLGAVKELPKLHKPDYSKHDTDEKLIAEAGKREKHATHFYERYMKKVTSDTIKTIFNALLKVEKQHIEILK